MNRQEFRTNAIKARWYWKQMREEDKDYTRQLLDLFSELCDGDRNVSYSLVYLWVCCPDNEVYQWPVEYLWERILRQDFEK